MSSPSTLTTIPADIHYHLLSILPDFYDLGAVIRTHRCFHDVYKTRRKTLLDDVAKNLLGCLFDEAVLLARAQEATYGLGDPSVKGFSSDTVILVVNNDYILKSLEMVVFGLMKADEKKFDIYDAESLERFVEEPFTEEASPTESIRFKAAGYRFWRFVLQPAKKRTAFLKKLAPNELLELRHFVSGISNLIYAIRRQPQESDHDWDFISSVQSTGPENILRLWMALQNGDPEFEEELAGAGYSINGDEGFFDYPYVDIMEKKKLNEIRGIDALAPIFDGDNEKMHEMLDEFSQKAGTDAES
ncbi:hypothetical protein MVEN_01970500 [Mycena venus]|uniref:Uncharacterized protein n=1 Tax=Mycena venus TaxID=2733690 RepID=A0A8H6XCS1_9AGAR|nr:hypothetical protein MVEN_01970500 [Mycena venus]